MYISLNTEDYFLRQMEQIVGFFLTKCELVIIRLACVSFYCTYANIKTKIIHYHGLTCPVSLKHEVKGQHILDKHEVKGQHILDDKHVGSAFNRRSEVSSPTWGSYIQAYSDR